MDKLKIDPEFQSLIPPLTEEERTQLEENILAEGAVVSPIIVWDSIIVDGHNRFSIIEKHPEVTYSVYEKQFTDRYEAIAWICKNQLGRRNLTPQQKKYLIGQRYEAERNAHGGDRKSEAVKSSGQIGHLISNDGEKARERIARETNTTDAYVKRAGTYAKGVDAAEAVFPGIKQELLTGAIVPTDAAVAAIAKAEPEQRPKLAQALRVTKDEKRKTRSEQAKKVAAMTKALPTSSKEATGTPPAPGRFKNSHEELQEIRRISEGMLTADPDVSPEIYLDSVEGAVEQMMRVCDHLFREYPCLLSEPIYREKVLKIMQAPKKYILDLERGSAI